MNTHVQSQLLAVNRRFYDRFAASFSVTRDRVQPGVYNLLPELTKAGRILDLGCGNGTLSRALAREGFTGSYLGTDMSEGLLTEARSLLGKTDQGNYNFQQSDLTNPDWEQTLPGSPFDWLVCFAVLHHLPGDDLRLSILQSMARVVSPESRIAISVWQWQNSPRLHKHVLPWSEVGLSAADVDEGDVLLDWRAADQVGVRYVHTYSEDDLTTLAETAGFKVLDSFYSDGKSGNLALYQIWQLIGF